jgi:hypothetical protein
LADSFEDTKQGSDGDERRKAEAESVAAKYNTPCHDVGSEVFGNRYPLKDPVGRVFDDEHSEVYTGSEPPKLSQVSKAHPKSLLLLTVAFDFNTGMS